ncbi:unnamed protein product [Pseudo-nitzschia multistriata]|uniref:Methyltransferase domain-containing protein n=1 Tax=Pseudo-nitzschia multistriata TaxID=183589 RepID=A0A448ZNL1_9STRA|nr:unnamed protein product [Pseudo-nitzschia multistriata]
MKNFYLDNDNLQQQGECALPLKPTANTDLILKTIMDHFAFHDAPVDVKEMAESMEFYLRTRKRLMGMAKKRIMKNARSGNGDEDSICTKCEVNEKIVQVFDMCSGHGLTGMLFAACNPPKATQNNRTLVVETHLVDVVEPLSHVVLRELIADVCPWIKDNVYFHACRLEELITTNDRSTDVSIECSNENDSDTAVVAGSCPIVIATHACGKLTDQVLHQAVDMNACAIAAMPCCYTGTDKGVSYGIRRALGVAWAADIRRTQFLDDNKYHVDYATIPLEITPLNRIIMAEERL